MSDVIKELLAQHEEIRQLIDRCEGLADRLDMGRAEPAHVLAEVANLRETFENHRRYEEERLRPIVDDHIDEHRAVHDGLGSPITAELRATLARLRHHLDSEERFFSTAQ